MGKRTDEHKSVFGNRKDEGIPGATADWSNASCDKVLHLITCASSRGGAVRFGYTRDGGAYAVGLYYGGEHKTEYCRPSENIDSHLDDYCRIFEDLPYSGGAAPK